MAHINTKRYHALATTNAVITRSATGHFEPIERVIQDSIEHRIFITMSSNNPENRFKATTGETITILVFTMTNIAQPTITLFPFVNDVTNTWSATVTETPSGTVWIAKLIVPSIDETEKPNLKQFIDIRVETQKNNENVVIPYTPIPYNRIQLV